MKHAEQLNVLKELIHQIDTGTTCDAGRVVLNPTSSYTDQALAEREWKVFFEEHPQVIGFSSELPAGAPRRRLSTRVRRGPGRSMTRSG
ncbi:MAG: hypothetical protein RLW62_04690 [Gammaproteobacteria bacterium]